MENNLEIMQAMMDDEFQEIISNDQIINNLQKERFNPRLQFQQLMNITSKRFILNGTLEIHTITPFIWCLLNILDSPYIHNNNEIKNSDTDLILYLLAHNCKQIKDNFIQESIGFTAKCGFDYLETQLDIKNIIYVNLRPLEMLNFGGESSQNKSTYNADWLTSIVSIIAPLTNKDSQYIMYEMSLTEAFLYIIQKQRETNKYIYRKNADQINEEIFKRTMELGYNYYKDKYSK